MDPRVSFVIATHNRRDVLLRTLEHLSTCGLPAGDFEILVVDNASTDGTCEAVSRGFRAVKLIRPGSNRGPCAKNLGVERARGEFVVFLDDDSHPRPGAVWRMIEHFRAEPGLGAAVFDVTLPDGSRECSAYPDVCIGCGTGFRREALIEVGGLPGDFFMAAEEYDLSLRLLDAGWRMRTFEDLHVTHLKSPQSRFPARIARLDARNNLMLAMRYFPDPWRTRYALAWMERYRLMAIANGNRRAFWLGAIEGLARAATCEHRPMRARAFEQFAKVEQTRARMADAKRSYGIRRVLFIDLGKNFLAYEIAAAECGVEIVAIADSRLGGRRLRYRDIPIVSDEEAMGLGFDVAVVSNLSPVHAGRRYEFWRRRSTVSVLDLFGPSRSAQALAA
jgi:GT2 family glycosyltransferase